MPTITILKPTDQPTGRTRLIDQLKTCLNDDRLSEFKFIVAFAKLGPLLRLASDLEAWKSKSKTVRAVFGVDQQGTSSEALDFAIKNFDSSFVSHVKGKFSPTFHPKIYIFQGSNFAIAYIGSNNLTVGGTETNFESYIKLELNLPEENELYQQLLDSWQDAVDNSLPLNLDLLKDLEKTGLVISELAMRAKNTPTVKREGEAVTSNDIKFPAIKIQPPSAIPRNKTVKKKQTSKEVKNPSEKTPPVAQIKKDLPATALVIQIIPHHNGEVLLSKLAVDQNPAFFGWPFTGQATPKIATNPSYPHRSPRPKVNIALYNSSGEPVFTQDDYDLTTVYYTSKSEIRITVPQEIYQLTRSFLDGPYPIMLIEEASPDVALDYNIYIYLPESTEYEEYLSNCNQSMPSGGKPIARKFGWL